MNSIRVGGFMATAVIGHRGDRRSDNLFFSGMAVITLASVFMGFAHTYYQAGVFQAPLPNLLVHIHHAAGLGGGGPPASRGSRCTEQDCPHFLTEACVGIGNSQWDLGGRLPQN
jgi:hypothetical protein